MTAGFTPVPCRSSSPPPTSCCRWPTCWWPPTTASSSSPPTRSPAAPPRRRSPPRSSSTSPACWRSPGTGNSFPPPPSRRPCRWSPSPWRSSHAFVDRHGRERSTGFWMVSLVFFFQLLASLLARPSETPGGARRAIFHDPIFSLHVSFALLGYAAFAVGAAYAFLYLQLYRDLKAGRFSTFYGKLPPLAVLERMMLIALGAGFRGADRRRATGALWAERLYPKDWLHDPKILATLITWGLLRPRPAAPPPATLAGPPDRLRRPRRPGHHFVLAGGGQPLPDRLPRLPPRPMPDEPSRRPPAARRRTAARGRPAPPARAAPRGPSLLLLGLDFRTVPIDLRERVAYSPGRGREDAGAPAGAPRRSPRRCCSRPATAPRSCCNRATRRRPTARLSKWSSSPGPPSWSGRDST